MKILTMLVFTIIFLQSCKTDIEIPNCDNKGYAIKFKKPWIGCRIIEVKTDTIYNYRGYTKDEIEKEIEEGSLQELEYPVCLCECICDTLNQKQLKP